MPLRRFRKQYEQLSQFERERIIGMREAGWSTRRAARQLSRSDCVVRRWAPVSSRTIRSHLAEGHLGSRHPVCVLPWTATHRRLHLELCLLRGNWTAVEWNQVIFSDESRFNLSSNDNRVRVWRPRGERLKPTFALQQHTTPTAGVMVWGAIADNTWQPIVLIYGTMIAQRYVLDILQPQVFPLMQRLPGDIFQQDNAWPHTARMSQDCLWTVTTLPWRLSDPQIFLQSSISGVIWDGELGLS
ncbi:transposable element Tcb2 transposase [Trichonephila clavipes]|nr:transposable element Tcb2 transposase [Trichonephila clavipes]